MHIGYLYVCGLPVHLWVAHTDIMGNLALPICIYEYYMYIGMSNQYIWLAIHRGITIMGVSGIINE